MRAIRWAAALGAAGVLWSALAAPLAAQEMMLRDDSPPNYTAYGWTFLSMTLVSAGYAVYSYQESQDALDDADSSFQKYQDATTEADALKYRADTEDARDDARAHETRANLAIAATLVFGLTAYFSFNPDHQPDMSLTLVGDQAVFQWRF